ncbi:MAG: signal peptide peptidase SppA [Kiritimatiellia bacterium]
MSFNEPENGSRVPPPMPEAPRQRKKAPSGCLWTLIVSQALVLVVILAVALGGVGMCFAFRKPVMSRKAGVDEMPPMQEIWSCGKGDVKVVRIPLKGMILLEEGGFFPSGAGSARVALRSIQRATMDPNVRAIIMEIDSGGGGITASDVLYKALLDFKRQQKGRKVVSVFGDVAASGAYYVALASDHVTARPTTITGSIGVLIQTFNLRELGRKVGVKDVTIKSGENKDLLNPFDDTETGQWKEQRAMLQGVIDELHGRFVSLVAKGRGLEEERVREIADGSIFTASKALDLGLVDEIGYWDDAMTRTRELLSADKIKVFRYEPEFSFSALLRSSGEWDPVNNVMRESRQPRFLYMWRP